MCVFPNVAKCNMLKCFPLQKPIQTEYCLIAGTMLLVTALFNFILSKKTKSPKRPQENNSDQGLTTVCATERAGSESTLSFFHMMIGRRRGEVAHTTPDICLDLGDRSESIQAMLNLKQTAAPKETGRERRSILERRLVWFRGREEPAEREMEEIDSCEQEPDSTSDTAPMITDWTSLCTQTELLTVVTQWKACIM